MTAETQTQQTKYRYSPYTHLLDEPEPVSGWHVLWTRSNFEKIVYETLHSRGYDVFLPMMNRWSKIGDSRHTCRVPMFRGYLFVRHAIDREEYIRISKTNGLVSILGSRWDKLARVPDREIETIKLAVNSQVPAMPHPFLENGDRVRIRKGTLAGAEGIMVKSDPDSGLLVISVNLLRRSIAVEVDCTDVEPV